MPRFLLSTFFVLLSLACAAPQAHAAPQELLPSQVEPASLAIIFSGQEQMHYEVSWSGGVKIGDIHLHITRDESGPDNHVISAQVKSTGPLNVFYPVDDAFHCAVTGAMKLPLRYEVFQREGHGRKVTKRVTIYDQAGGVVKYQKNQQSPQLYPLKGKVYNEFAAFVISRALKFAADSHIIVPTFADNKRNEVAVRLLKKEKRPSIFGERQTLKMQPIMNFKGLYEKSGNTLLWLTDDRCRVPVEIRSRIVVGSLVAKLVGYSNPACPDLQMPSQQTKK
ncbi:MAG: DUF3108 domain-containing protein [bacterium]|nr:DUF3108 domain-containing protein [bacterium]